MTEHIQFLGFWTPGPIEVIVILVVALLIFGRRLPEVMRSVGRSVHQFRKGLREVEDDITSSVESPEEDAGKLAKGGSDSQSSSPAG